ncbi:MAG: hypothetical protein ACYDGL_00850 [Bellilinea sp.]
MKNPFMSKTIFLWQVSAAAGGRPDDIAAWLKNAGFEGVIVKVADGPYAYRPPVIGWSENLSMALITALRANGLAVIGYGFLYGYNPTGEADVAIVQTQKYGLDGYVFDVEGQFDARSNAEANAYALMSRYRKSCPDTPTAFCSWALWRSPKTGAAWHPLPVARAFMQFCDIGMPMIYWGGETANDMDWWLKNSLIQWRQLTEKPIIPAGRAYHGDGGKALPNAMQAFEAGVRDAGLRGITWWSMQHAMVMPDVWAALGDMEGFAQVIADPAPDVVSFFAWAREIDAWARRNGYTGPIVSSG